MSDPRKVRSTPIFDPPVIETKKESKAEKENEEFQELKTLVAGSQQSVNKGKEYVFKPLREEILRRASWKNGVTVTGLTTFLSSHKDFQNLTPEIYALRMENLISINPVQIKQEAALYGGSYQTLIQVIK